MTPPSSARLCPPPSGLHRGPGRAGEGPGSKCEATSSRDANSAGCFLHFQRLPQALALRINSTPPAPCPSGWAGLPTIFVVKENEAEMLATCPEPTLAEPGSTRCHPFSVVNEPQGHSPCVLLGHPPALGANLAALPVSSFSAVWHLCTCVCFMPSPDPAGGYLT